MYFPDFSSGLFQSTLPARGATRVHHGRIPREYIFQSTLPARGATRSSSRLTALWCYFNPRSPHGERHCRVLPGFQLRVISIHAPRTGSDARPPRPHSARVHISIHAPRTGSDASACAVLSLTRLFQSTLPARGATGTLARSWRPLPFQSTLPARGATPREAVRDDCRCISIHAPRTGSDAISIFSFVASTIISIHAPRTGSDTSGRPQWLCADNFNPRSPHGERPRLRA